MTSLENYSQIIETIFGAGTTTFSNTSPQTNHVIDALNSQESNYFTKNFKARLIRLKNIYAAYPDYMKNIIVQVNEISSHKNWEGAFAELAAYDHLNQDLIKDQNYLFNPIEPNVTLPNIASYAQELGKHETNVDGFVGDRNLYFDVKCFKDNIKDILEGIYDDLKKHLGIRHLTITAEHELDTSYDDYQNKRNQLLNELKAKISLTDKVNYVSSTVITGLSFRILWGPGIQMTESSYNPFIHAQNYHKTIFNYASKFLKNNSNVIVLVIFPWYNNIVNDFSDSNKAFYRALSRRVFCQYKFDPTPFKSFNSKFTGSDTIYEVSKHLSGIIFLEDCTITNKNPDESNVKSYVYFNPNSIKPLIRSLSGEYLIGLHNEENDNFEYDNY
jgi:hypothetical protein